MKYQVFVSKLRKTLPVNTVLPNPGGGTTTIVSYTSEKVAYRRGNSRIYVGLHDLYEAYDSFRGKTIDSTTLREVKAGVFDSQQGGHSCNCTFFYMALKAMGIIGRIEGQGKRGNPYQVTIPE